MLQLILSNINPTESYPILLEILVFVKKPNSLSQQGFESGVGMNLVLSIHVSSCKV